ncbi:MAG TPA: cysteine desulfurase family protein [Bacteroidia bacterium]|jgi:cysteine desulfurase|nr:cysteine desulfurase family protein [Bacteroidia bacterium]HQF27974.1 cysteine desulfurase family protein [Bacteroidia bacterium]HQK97996.1 cysteine desulfurase family protein [Bacteroidia bacterium]
MKVYLDNAATTAIHPDVVETMIPVLRNQFGNPSSIHAFGREVRSAVEAARKKVATLLKTSPSEIFFTSGGTEADNMAIRCGIHDLGLKHAITSALEHHAVLHTLEELAHKGDVKLSIVNVDEQGHIDLVHLEELLKNNDRSFISLMHANNEIGTLIPLQQVGELCRKYDAVFHSDTVQTMGHFAHDLSTLPVDFVTCAAHKFHGPKGVGFLYINKRVKIKPFITGGAQERNMRGGTENVYGIIGLAKALEIAYNDMQEDVDHIKGLKNYMAEQLVNDIPGVRFNGDISDNSLYTVLNVSFPPTENAEMLLFNLDIAGIACSAGSACSSGSDIGSHVLRGIKADMTRPSIRFSFCRFNTKEEIDYTLEKLKELFLVKA